MPNDAAFQMAGGQTIFVYGSLKRGGHNHHLIENAEFVGFDSITAKNISTERLHAIVPGEGLVRGEVYNVEGWSMIWVDQLEGIDWGFYYKEEVETHQGRKVWVYFLNWCPQIEGLPALY